MPGRAIRINNDMRAFAQEAALSLMRWTYSERNEIPTYNKVYRRQVDAGKYGKREIYFISEQMPSQDKRFERVAYAYLGGIHINENLLINNGYNLKDAETAVLHELVHCFDPKVCKGILQVSYDKKRIGLDLKYEKYLNFAEEIDANMASLSEERLRHLKRYSLKRALFFLSNIKPKNQIEIEWKKRPKLWRKYINTIYQGLQEDQKEKIKYVNNKNKVNELFSEYIGSLREKYHNYDERIELCPSAFYTF
jgi:hypothetical protein